MGTEAKQIFKLQSFKKKKYEKDFDIIFSKFDAYFMPKKMSSTSMLNVT